MDAKLITIWIILILEVIFIGVVGYFFYKRKIIISKSSLVWFLPVFLFLFVLYMFAHITQTSGFGALDVSAAFVAAFKSFAFEINSTYTKYYIENYVLYAVTFYIAYALALITVFASAIALVKEYLLNALRVGIFKIKKTDILIGLNPSTLTYARKEQQKALIWLDDAVSSDQIKMLQQEKIAYLKGPFTDQAIRKRCDEKREYHVILFEGQETKYQRFIDLFLNLNETYQHLFLSLEVQYQEMEVVRSQYLVHKDKNPHLYIKTFSRYEMIARKFVTEFTIPKYLPASFYNANYSVKQEKEINVFFYGFGKVNASLFTMFCQNNQMVTINNGRLAAKPVNYYIIDRDEGALNQKRIDYMMQNHESYDSDLPPVEKMANYHHMMGDINSHSVITKVKELARNKNSMNYFIVSFGDDYENVEAATWLRHQFSESEAVIACRTKREVLVNKDIICFGQEAEILSHEYIVDEKLQELAFDVNQIYHQTKTPSERALAWENLGQIELYSNYYSAMNIVFKLNLLGFDLVKDTAADSISKEMFMSRYNEGEISENKYENYFKTTVRNVIAYGEKLRWNAFYLFNDYRPMLYKDIVIESKKQMKTKDPKRKVHAFLTSHHGLDVLHQYLVDELQKLNIKVGKEDVEKYIYDYMSFDYDDQNMFDTLLNQGYKIIALKKID